MSDLGRIEAFFQTYIVDPRGDDEVGHGARREAARLIRPSSSLNPVERLNVYRDQYLARMEEALGADYPALRHFLGEAGFWELVTHYVESHPSRSWNLSRLSDRVPEYVEGATWLRRQGFALDMARLEHALCVVFEAAHSKALTQQQIAAVPEEAWATARIKPVEALRVLQFAYPVNDYLEAVKRGEPLPATARRTTHVVVWRSGYDMWRMPLSPNQYRLLSGLIAGQTLGEVLMAATHGRHRSRPEEVFQAFSSWIGEGMFAELVLSPSRLLAAASA